MIDRIEERLAELGMSAAAASLDAGLGRDYIRDLRRKPVKPGAESLDRLARTLKTTPEYLLFGKTGSTTLPVKGLPVVGVIEAGQYRDITLASQDDEYETVNVVRDQRYSNARQYALRVSGDSMNELFPDGSFVICAEFADTGLALKDGMVVHVERRIANTHLVETTLKQVKIEGKAPKLIPRSTNPRHKPISVRPDDELNETRVQGLVIGSYQPVDF